jgi:hypothetical protein
LNYEKIWNWSSNCNVWNRIYRNVDLASERDCLLRKLRHWPEDGEVRWKEYYAWLPIAVNNNIVWFDSYWVKEKYQRHHGDLRNFADGFWYEVKDE